MAEPTVSKVCGIGNGKAKGNNIEIWEHRDGNTGKQQASRKSGASEAKSHGKRNCRMSEDGWHWRPYRLTQAARVAVLFVFLVMSERVTVLSRSAKCKPSLPLKR